MKKNFMVDQENNNTCVAPKKVTTEDAYWRTNIKILSILMVIWFAVSFGAGILFSTFLDQYTFLGFPLGFWFSQQGAIYAFVIIIFAYNSIMKRVDQTYTANTKSEVKVD